MKVLKRMICFNLFGLLMAFPQMNQAAINAPQGDSITISVMGQQFSAEALHPVSLLPITIKISTPNGTVLYSTTQAVGSITIPASASSSLIRKNRILSDGIDYRVSNNSIEHGIIADGTNHSVSGNSVEHLVLTATQGGNIIIEKDLQIQ